MKRILFYIEYYIFNLPLYLFHEISHWVFIFPLFLIRLCSFPRLEVLQWAYCRECDEGREQYSFRMQITYINYYNIKYINKLSAVMPVFSTITLFWISPWYLYPYYLSHINTLWLSDMDIKHLKD